MGAWTRSSLRPPVSHPGAPASREADDVRKALDEVVGTKFDALLGLGFAKRLRGRLPAWIVAAALAAVTVLALVAILVKNLAPHPIDLPRAKPVEVELIPANPAR